MSRAEGKQLQKRRSELCKRAFSHVSEAGGRRRSWLKGLIDVTKRYVMAAAARNRGRLQRTQAGVGKPLSRQGAGLWAKLATLLSVLSSQWEVLAVPDRRFSDWEGKTGRQSPPEAAAWPVGYGQRAASGALADGNERIRRDANTLPCAPIAQTLLG